MFHHTATVPSLNTNFSYPSLPASNPHDRYLAALAEAQAAEAEYLASEATRREEEQLQRHLKEIQLRKREEELLLRRRGRTPSQSSSVFNPYPVQGYDRLAALRRQIEEEEVLLAIRLRETELEQAALRRREIELEASRLISEKEAALRLRQVEEQRTALLRDARFFRSPQNSCGHHCRCPTQQKSIRGECARKGQVTEYQSSHPFLQDHLATQCQAPVTPEKKQTAPVQIDINVQDLLNRHIGGSTAPAPKLTSKPKAPAALWRTQETAKPVEAIEELLKDFFRQVHPSAQEKQPAQCAPKQPSVRTGVQQILDVFGQFVAPVQQQATPKPSASSSKVPSVPTQPESDGAQQVLNLIFGQPQEKNATNQKQAPATVPEPTAKAPEASAPAPEPASVESSLKTQLEARLNNEYASEVRDTIQAIFASLQHAESSSATSASTSSPAPSSKGKEKATEPSSTTPSPANATSKDVVESMDAIRNIEAAFLALESDFIFPSQLDFNIAHVTASNNLASSDSEGSASTHLAYTSRNHPVRFYEQALGALLAQLDSVDSFGNDALRSRRKEVVGRVERALEELEQEVAGRWRARLHKEAKSFKVEITSSESTSPPSTGDVSQTTDEAVANTVDQPPLTEVPSNDVTLTEPAVATSDDVELDPSSSSDEETVPTDTSPPTDASAKPEAPSPASELADTVTSELSGVNKSQPVSSVPALAFATTSKPYEVLPMESEADGADTFLLSAAGDVEPRTPAKKDIDSDAGSDWSEVEA